MSTKISNVKVATGDVFLVPLRSSGYAVGIVTRRRGTSLLGFFWKSWFPSIPTSFDFSLLKREDVFWKKQFAALALQNGLWPIIGRMPNFKLSEWEVPLFYSHTEPASKYLLTYSDDLIVIKRELLPDDFVNAGQYPENGMAGYGFIEIKLTKLIHSEV